MVTWGRNWLRETDNRLRLWLRGRRVVVGDALERAIGELVLLVAGHSSALAFFAHFSFFFPIKSDRNFLNFGG